MVYEYAIIRICLVGSLNLFVYWTFYLIITPALFNRQKYVWLVVSGFGATIVSYLLKKQIDLHFVSYFHTISASPSLHFITIAPQGLIILIACLLSILKINFYKEQTLMQLRVEEAHRELELIKARINPHFLLNTLNNIYSINYANNPGTSKAILQLSKVLSYTIYRNKNELIPLYEEVDSMLALIGLYQLRYNQSLNITITYTKNVAISDKNIPSMVFFTFLENAIKHSGIAENEKGAYLHMTINLNGNLLVFNAENSFRKTTEVPATGYSKGLGDNTIQKLLHRHFGEKYKLEIKNAGEKYTVNLIIHEF